jgi:hypothetical protein
MTDEYDEQLKQLFDASDVDSPEEGFTGSVMVQVRRYQRRSVLWRSMAGLGLLVIASPLAFHYLSGALDVTLFPGEVSLSAATGQFAQLPLLFLACLAATGYLLLNPES